ncbi:MAG: T9SS type A sorting domain-containing protein, partial [Chitinophagaceae bacterium]
RPTYTLKETTTVNTYPYAVTVSANSVTVLKLSGPAPQGNGTEIKLINNPVRGIAYISVSDIRYTPLFVDLYDTKGSLLKRYPQINTNGTLPIDVNGFPTGIYFLRFTSPASHQTIKIFKN